MTTRDESEPITPDQAQIAAAALDLVAGGLITVDNGHLFKVHLAQKCEGESCWVHNPSGHHMASWPIQWNASLRTVFRICTHDVEHPDPDDVDYYGGLGVDTTEHDCDGCCSTTA